MLTKTSKQLVLEPRSNPDSFFAEQLKFTGISVHWKQKLSAYVFDIEAIGPLRSVFPESIKNLVLVLFGFTKLIKCCILSAIDGWKPPPMPTAFASILQQSMADLRHQAANSAMSGDQSGDQVGGVTRDRMDSTELINNKSDKCEYCGKVKYIIYKYDMEAMPCSVCVTFRIKSKCYIIVLNLTTQFVRYYSQLSLPALNNTCECEIVFISKTRSSILMLRKRTTSQIIVMTLNWVRII